MNEPSIRAYRSSDLEALARVYRDAIRHIGGSCYTSEQVDAWSGFAEDRDAFRKWLENADTLVAVDGDDKPIGFAGLDARGRIESLFVAPSAARNGIGSALLARALEKARERGMTTLTTSASELSKPVFEKFGFEVTEIEHTGLKGVAFTRYTMRRPA